MRMRMRMTYPEKEGEVVIVARGRMARPRTTWVALSATSNDSVPASGPVIIHSFILLSILLFCSILLFIIVIIDICIYTISWIPVKYWVRLAKLARTG